MFNNLIGNEENKRILENIIKTGSITHSYMFIGKEGIGKKLFAIEFAKNILSSENIYNNPDFKLIEPEGNSLKIEQIRQLIEKIYEKPIVSNKKIYIIDDADKMTKEAANCLLKTLEEPPEYMVIILIVSNESAMLNTIKSRCSKILFNKIENNLLITHIGLENITENMLNLIDGSFKEATKITQNVEIYKTIENLVFNINKLNVLEFIKQAKVIYESKEELDSVLKYMNILFLQLAKETNNIKYLNCIKHIEKARNNISKNANYEMNIDMMIMNIFDERN